MNKIFTIADARELLDAADSCRKAVDDEVRALRKQATLLSTAEMLGEMTAAITAREIYSLPLFDRAADALAVGFVPESQADLVRHVLERARAAVNNHALRNGGATV